MPAWSTYSYAFGPIVAAVAIIVFVVILRWSSKKGSLVTRTPKRASEADYGLLVVVARPADYIRGELTRRQLEDAGVRATLVHTTDGPRVMVWPEEEERALQILTSAGAG